MMPQCIHIIFMSYDAIYIVTCTGPSCRNAAPQQDAAIIHIRDSVLMLAGLPPFYSK